MNLNEVFKQFPPAAGETGSQYFFRLSEMINRPALTLRNQTELFLYRNGFKRGIDGLRAYLEKNPPATVEPAEERAAVHWSEWIDLLNQHQTLAARESKTEYKAAVRIDTDKPICLIFLSDLHIGCSGVDYEIFVQITKELIEIPNLYCILGGDEVNFAIKLRNVSEVHGDILNPSQQLSFLKSWFEDIKHKVIAACGGNHDAHRTLSLAGINPFADVFTKVVPYSPGMFALKLTVGQTLYSVDFHHIPPKGRSMYNVTHSHKRYAREENPEADVIMSGHIHRAGFTFDVEGGKPRVYVSSGTTKTNDSYAKTYFSLTTAPVFPAVVLFPDRKLAVPFPSVRAYLEVSGLKEFL